VSTHLESEKKKGRHKTRILPSQLKEKKKKQTKEGIKKEEKGGRLFCWTRQGTGKSGSTSRGKLGGPAGAGYAKGGKRTFRGNEF